MIDNGFVSMQGDSLVAFGTACSAASRLRAGEGGRCQGWRRWTTQSAGCRPALRGGRAEARSQGDFGRTRALLPDHGSRSVWFTGQGYCTVVLPGGEAGSNRPLSWRCHWSDHDPMVVLARSSGRSSAAIAQALDAFGRLSQIYLLLMTCHVRGAAVGSRSCCSFREPMSAHTLTCRVLQL